MKKIHHTKNFDVFLFDDFEQHGRRENQSRVSILDFKNSGKSRVYIDPGLLTTVNIDRLSQHPRKCLQVENNKDLESTEQVPT